MCDLGGAAELVPLDGQPMEAELQAIGANELTFSATTPIAFPLDELVRWGHPQPARGQIIVVLADGGRLVSAAAWAGGAAVRLEKNEVVVLSDTFDKVPLPRSSARGIVFALRYHQRDRERLEQIVRESAAPAVRSAPSTDDLPERDPLSDTVLLTNKDRVTGELKGLSGGSLTFQTHGGEVKLPLSRIEAIVFSRRRGEADLPSIRTPRAALAVGLRDGSLLYANRAEADESGLTVTLGSGVTLKGGQLKDVTFLQSLGGRFVYLSDLEPAGYRHVPYLSIEWPYKRDRNVQSEALSVGGKRYLKGIGMHSASRLTFALERKYRRFDASVALDDSAGNQGSVTFGVHVLHEGQWRERYTSGIVRGGEVPRPLSVDVSGAEGLTLTVDFADRGDELDHADWLDARLVKEM